MPTHRANTSNNQQRQPAPGKFAGQFEDRWFAKLRKRSDVRNLMAFYSRRKNRQRSKGK